MRLARHAVSSLAGLVLILSATAGVATADEPEAPWGWPLAGATVSEPFEAPAHAYGPGHRGIDLVSTTGDPVVDAPAAGVVAFAGTVVDRGVLTIDHGDGWVSTFEPVDAAVAAGTPVSRGEAVAVLSVGGHAEPGALHFGVRRHGEYINPLLLLGGIPRAVLLPCC